MLKSMYFTFVDDDFKELFLLEANKYRRIHSAVSLSWSAELTRKAQQWAEYLAEKDEYRNFFQLLLILHFFLLFLNTFKKRRKTPVPELFLKKGKIY